MKNLFLHLFLLLLSGVTFLAGPARGAVALTFGVYASDKPTSMVRQFRPLLNLIEAGLAERLGEPVQIKLHIARDYDDGIRDIVTGAVDFSRLGPVSYVLASKQDCGLSVLAVESNHGTKTFQGVICVQSDSPIQGVEELRGKSFAFGNRLSTIGRYLSQLYLLDHGIRGSDLSRYEYLDRHDRVGAAVAQGSFTAGALKESTFRKLVAKGDRLRAIATFPNVTKPWVARSGLDETLQQHLRQVLYNIRDQQALKALGKDGFLPGGPEDYADIRRAIDENQRFFE